MLKILILISAVLSRKQDAVFESLPVYQQGEIVTNYLTDYYQTVYDDSNVRSLAWASTELQPYYSTIVDYIQNYPVYNWPLYARYSVFPDIYGYFEPSKLVEFWKDPLA